MLFLFFNKSRITKTEAHVATVSENINVSIIKVKVFKVTLQVLSSLNANDVDNNCTCLLLTHEHGLLCSSECLVVTACYCKCTFLHQFWGK